MIFSDNPLLCKLFFPFVKKFGYLENSSYLCRQYETIIIVDGYPFRDGHSGTGDSDLSK